MEFSELPLENDLQKSLAEAGYITATPVQEQVLQKALDGVDVYAQSQTGTGKTAAYLVVIMQRMLTNPLLRGKKALIMVPTRELAVQVEEEAQLVGKYCPFKTASFYGGVGYGQQQASLRDDAQILVGTPGRVLDLNASGHMNLMDLGFLILDEADRMFDMGFYPDLRKLIQVVPPPEKRQTMLFSATLNAYVKNLAWEYTKDPIEIEIEPEHVTVNEISQLLYHVPSEDKFRLLLGILEREKPETAIIFCNTKRYTEILSDRLQANGYQNEFISGDLPQMQRLKVIENIKNGKTRLLIATDVAARGLDIEDLDMVLNYDLPAEDENYVHRIGRTARAGKSGKAITFVCEQDIYELPGIERYIGMKLPSEVASAEMYGKDTSRRRPSGSRGRMDAAERRPLRQGRSGGRRSGGGGRERLPPPERGEKRERQQGRERKPREREGEPERQPAVQRPKLSALSLEERREYYKQKYESAPAAGGAGRRPKRGPKKEGARGAPRQKRQHSKSGKPPARGNPPKEAAPKGLFARIKQMFKKDE